MANVRRRTAVVHAVCSVVLFVASAAKAQECPVPAEPRIKWVGQNSGCTETQGTCAVAEPILFSAVPSTGGTYPGCMTFFWNFGDGTDSNQATPTHVYPLNGTFFVNVQVISSAGDAFAGSPIVVSATVTPKVDSFTTSALRVSKGKPIVLTWVVRNATRIRIDPINLELDASVTSYKFVPAETRTYTLTAYGGAAIAFSQPVTVVVGARRRGVRH